MQQFKEITLLESLLNFQKDEVLTVLCSYYARAYHCVFDPVICKTPDAPLHCLPFCEVKW